METVFVTRSSQLTDRWRKAFPEAQLVSRVADLSAKLKEPGVVVWLDISSLSEETRSQDIAKAVAFGCPVVVMAAMPAEAEAFQVLNTGVAGYCHIQAAPEQLREIALVVQNKGTWMPPELMQRLLKLSLRVVPPELALAGSQLEKLTARELTVAQQVAIGATNREISDRLDITERTVKAHLSTTFEKLGVRDRVQLALCMNNIDTATTVN
jgi:two-component system nitrate/nitrite response regulator NarL